MKTCKIVDIKREYEKTKLVTYLGLQFSDKNKQVVTGNELFVMIDKGQVRVANLNYKEFYLEIMENTPGKLIDENKEDAINELAKLSMLGLSPEVNARGWITGISTQNLVINNACNETFLPEIKVDGDITFKCDTFICRGIYSSEFKVKASEINVMNPNFAENILAQGDDNTSGIFITCPILILGYKFETEDKLFTLRKIINRLFHGDNRLNIVVPMLGSGVVRISSEELVRYIKKVIRIKEHIDTNNIQGCSFNELYRSTIMENLFVDLAFLQIIYHSLSSDKEQDWKYVQASILEIVQSIESRFHDIFDKMIKYTRENNIIDIASRNTNLYNGGIIAFAKTLNTTFNNNIFTDMEI